jgi:hypothetical protein
MFLVIFVFVFCAAWLLPLHWWEKLAIWAFWMFSVLMAHQQGRRDQAEFQHKLDQERKQEEIATQHRQQAANEKAEKLRAAIRDKVAAILEEDEKKRLLEARAKNPHMTGEEERKLRADEREKTLRMLYEKEQEEVDKHINGFLQGHIVP